MKDLSEAITPETSAKWQQVVGTFWELEVLHFSSAKDKHSFCQIWGWFDVVY